MRIQPLSQFDAAALGVETTSPSGSAQLRAGIRGRSIVGDVNAPAVQISGFFSYQSYFDDTLLQRAILSQAPNEPIVASTLTQLNVNGYGLGLHPSSETPVAVRFFAGGQQGASSTYTLKPGQVIRPQGKGLEPGQFSGFEWGLPFGWLGGGNATIIVLRTADAKTDWLDRSEIIFHRARFPIYAPADVPASTALPYNWPTRFPWEQAVQGANAFSQRGTSQLATSPTRVALMLRLATLANPATMRIYFVGTDCFAMDSTGVVDLAAVPPGVDVVWGTWASVASANYASQYQVQMLTGEIERFGANNGAALFVANGSADLEDEFVDVVRYGKL